MRPREMDLRRGENFWLRYSMLNEKASHWALFFIQHTAAKSHRHDNPPTLYNLNASANTKPHAVEHLAVDLLSYEVDIAVIAETHLKKKHRDHCFSVNGHSLFRRDRVGRRGGDVAVCVNSRLSADTGTGPGDSSDLELLWVHVQTERRDIMIGALYHPPKPLYRTIKRTTPLHDVFRATIVAIADDVTVHQLGPAGARQQI